MSFVLTLPRRAFVLAMRDRNRANKNKIAIFAFSVATKDSSHDLLLDRDRRRFPDWTRFGGNYVDRVVVSSPVYRHTLIVDTF